MIEKPKGFIPVMLTPFRENGAVDFEGLTALIELYLSAGASGLFANCQSSEMFELTEQERLMVTRHVVNVVDGAVPVVAAGTFSRDTRLQADFVKQIYDTGVEAVIAVTGMLAEEAESDEVFEGNVFQLIELTEKIPLGFYECPVPYKRVLTAEQLRKFVATGRVIYHKDTCLDIELIKNKLAVTNEYNFGLYDAYMGHAVASLKAGSAGLSCIQGNYFPELIVWLCEHYNDARVASKVDQVQQFFINNMDVMHRDYPFVAKYYLQRRGLNISAFSRQGSNIISEKMKSDMAELHTQYRLIQESLELQTEI